MPIFIVMKRASNDQTLCRLKLRKSILALGICGVALFITDRAQAQARVDLEDLSVKGEILNDNRLRMSSRESSTIQDRVKYRKNFRPEIIDASDVRVPAAESLSEFEVK